MSKLKVKNSTETLEVQNVYCIGKNYIEHIKEFDQNNVNNEIPEVPVVFLKPNSAVSTEPRTVKIPEFEGRKISNNLHYEAELVVVMGRDGINISESESWDYVYGFAAGIDFTLRDIQSELKSKGLPWTLSKGFLTSAPVSLIVRKQEVNDPGKLDILLKANNEIRQKSNTSEMLFKISYLIHYISSVFGLKRGDLIFTGTPAGVSKVDSGDIIECEIEKIGKLLVKVA